MYFYSGVDTGDGTEFVRIYNEAVKGWRDGAAKDIIKLTGQAVRRGDIDRFLSGKLDKLPIDSGRLPSDTTLASVRGKTATIRKTLSRRLSDHHVQRRAFKKLGAAVDKRMGEGIPIPDNGYRRALRRSRSPSA
jgi:hypothetical protein